MSQTPVNVTLYWPTIGTTGCPSINVQTVGTNVSMTSYDSGPFFCSGLATDDPNCGKIEATNLGNKTFPIVPNPPSSFGVGKDYPVLLGCTYTIDETTSSVGIMELFSTFLYNPIITYPPDVQSQVMSEVLGAYCNFQTTTCPNDSTGTPMNECSRFVSTNTVERSLCNYYKYNLPDQAATTMQNYCSANNTEDCACINAIYNLNNPTAYNTVAANLPSGQEPSCWYKPCMDSQTWIIPVDMIQPQNCEPVCETLKIASGNTGSAINDQLLTQTTTCTLNGQYIPPAPQPSPGPNPGPSPPSPPPQPPSPPTSNTKKIIVIVLLVFALIVLFALIAYFVKRRK